MDIVAAALRARLAMVRGARRAKLEALLDRFEERAVGNPAFRRPAIASCVTAHVVPQ